MHCKSILFFSRKYIKTKHEINGKITFSSFFYILKWQIQIKLDHHRFSSICIGVGSGDSLSFLAFFTLSSLISSQYFFAYWTTTVPPLPSDFGTVHSNILHSSTPIQFSSLSSQIRLHGDEDLRTMGSIKQQWFLSTSFTTSIYRHSSFTNPDLFVYFMIIILVSGVL